MDIPNHKNLSYNSLENEVWMPITESNGKYQVSNMGRVRSMKRFVKGNWFGGIIMKQYQYDGKYCVLNLKINGKPKLCKVHRLVATAFIPNPLNKPEVNHLNGIWYDNTLQNLEWATGDENYLHAVLSLKRATLKIKTKKEPQPIKGREVYVYLADGSFYKKFNSIVQASKELKIAVTTISKFTKDKPFISKYGFTFSAKPLSEKIIIPNTHDKKKYQKLPPEINKTIQARKKIFVYDLKGNFVKEYKSLTDAQKVFKSNHIGSALKGKRVSIKGYSFKSTFQEKGEDLTNNINVMLQYSMGNSLILSLDSL